MNLTLKATFLPNVHQPMSSIYPKLAINVNDVNDAVLLHTAADLATLDVNVPYSIIEPLTLGWGTYYDKIKAASGEGMYIASFSSIMGETTTTQAPVQFVRWGSEFGTVSDTNNAYVADITQLEVTNLTTKINLHFSYNRSMLVFATTPKGVNTFMISEITTVEGNVYGSP